MGEGEADFMRGAGQLGAAQRRIMGASGRNGSARCDGPSERQSALKAHARGFLRRLPNDADGEHRYELTDRGRQVVAVLQKRGLIDGGN